MAYAEPHILGFGSYLQRSLSDPFVLNLQGMPLLDVINQCAIVKERLHPNYKDHLSSLIYNLSVLEDMYKVTLYPNQVTDIFWGYFIAFCQNRGLRNNTIKKLISQMKSILTWASRYNAEVSPSYLDIDIKKNTSNTIALTADEVSRITYFDIDRFYADRRKDFRKTMHRIRDMFVLSCNLYQRYSDMIRIEPSCFDRNTFRITQQKTGNVAVVNIDRFSIDSKTTYRILEKYGYYAPYSSHVATYDGYLRGLMRDIGFTENVCFEERIGGKMTIKAIPKWKLISSHTARRTAVTVNVLRGHNIHSIKKCSGHTSLDVFDKYIREEQS